MNDVEINVTFNRIGTGLYKVVMVAADNGIIYKMNVVTRNLTRYIRQFFKDDIDKMYDTIMKGRG